MDIHAPKHPLSLQQLRERLASESPELRRLFEDPRQGMVRLRNRLNTPVNVSLARDLEASDKYKLTNYLAERGYIARGMHYSLWFNEAGYEIMLGIMTRALVMSVAEACRAAIAEIEPVPARSFSEIEYLRKRVEDLEAEVKVLHGLLEAALTVTEV
jgi:chromosome segregation ATPase